MTEPFFQPRTAVFISTPMVRGLLGKPSAVIGTQILKGMVGDVENGNVAYVSGGEINGSHTLADMERILGADFDFDDMDMIVVYVPREFEKVVSQFARAGIPPEKMLYAACCKVEEAQEIINAIHPGVSIATMKCGSDEAFGRIISRFLQSGIPHVHHASVLSLTLT
ncbi:MAG: hypothetical protein JWN89_116 [Parcubacteria group bacterium]|nr:hypothetical protein [Parcubacteria group bacterium]